MSKAARSEAVKRDWGTDESETPIMHVDMDAFYAMCELARRPELRGKPVIIGGTEGRVVVLAATYEARAFGVRSAVPMATALRSCPGATVILPDFRLYSRISDSVIAMMREITPKVEQVSIDEAFLDLSGVRRLWGKPSEIGARLRARVEAEHGITCSVGIARNKFVAKVASTQAKPNGMLVIPAPATEDFLRELPVGAIWGVGAKTEENLAKWGIETVAQLADTDLPTLQAIVGKAGGAHLHALAWGKDPRSVTVSRSEKSIGNETTFWADQGDLTSVENRILALSDQVAYRLRRQGLVARTVALKVRTSDFFTVSRSRTLPGPTDQANVINQHCRELFRTVDLRDLPVRLVGVRAEQLTEREGLAEQITLDEAVSENPTQKRDAELALDQVRAKFGRRAINLGTVRGKYDDEG